ncbi:CDP-alcohol phosphatidyltransferase family protein [Myxococcota bacterium]|nr:CDP-alcohol phosphatidyltransferase family protein [Myxococcota bacterium]
MGEPAEPEDRTQRMRWSDLYNLPGALTLSRLPLAWLCAEHKHDRDALALGLAVFVLTDVLDGPLARRWGLSSRAGVFADGWLDKFFLVAFAWSMNVGGFVEGRHMLGWFARELVQAVMVPFFARRHVRAELPLRQPSAVGKLTTIVVTLGLVAALADQRSLTDLSAILACGLGLIAAGQYLWRELPWGREASDT